MARLGTRSVHLLAAALPAAVAIAALTACGGGGSSASTARQQAQARTLQASRTVTERLGTDEVVSSKGIVTSYDKCGATRLRYVASQPLEPLGQALTQAQLGAQLVTEMSGLGWKLTEQPKPAPDTIFYKIADHGLTGELYVNHSGLGLNANLFVNSACFDAGPGAPSLLKVQSTFPAPAPSSG
jgi:hypothetical protein